MEKNKPKISLQIKLNAWYLKKRIGFRNWYMSKRWVASIVKNHERRKLLRLSSRALKFIAGIDQWMKTKSYKRNERRLFWRKFIKNQRFRQLLAEDIISNYQKKVR